MRFPTRTIIEQRLVVARTSFLEKDRHLLEVEASEPSLTHKFAEALQRLFRRWHVDCEYNRVGHDAGSIKSLPQWANDYARKTGRIYPDIITHRRGTGQNAIVFEAKLSTANAARMRADEAKLRAFKQELNYRYAVQLTFHVGATPDINWVFID